ncbi:MAG: lipoyl synthase [Candidatus Mcinerneyibacterium aminivorans]|uniref:Lipoyl synthase n=1 Tax=Candidatus Mcinerneyibacterium aminivorans TaxID=2703815 RepID=A0A5D0MIP6_9BACT|nr:MAG: lipoyl synthase [Candidatus Mcinerneyibacterium aminivorans]
MPEWFLETLKDKRSSTEVEDIIRNQNLNTVCQHARCPNRGECFSKGTATFLLLGDTCTRNCGFCAINSGEPVKKDNREPYNILEAIKKMKLKYVVLTSVTRDDLELEGADIFAKTVKLIKDYDENIKVEVLTPDFNNRDKLIDMVVSSNPDVYNHNLETVEKYYSKIRPQAVYKRSLAVLEKIKKINNKIVTKSGIMVGLGEKKEEVKKVIDDLIGVKCDILTIGQYIQPTDKNYPVKEYVTPETYKGYEIYGKKRGIDIIAGPLVRSSYMAHEYYKKTK